MKILCLKCNREMETSDFTEKEECPELCLNCEKDMEFDENDIL